MRRVDPLVPGAAWNASLDAPRRVLAFYAEPGTSIYLLTPLLVGFFLRLITLGKQSLFLDEAFSADLVMHSWRGMIDLALRDVHPLLYYLLLKLTLQVFPLTEWSLRLLSAIFSVLSQALAMGITRKYASLRASSMVGWLFAFSSLHLYYAQEARMYGLLNLLWLLSPFLLTYLLNRQTLKTTALQIYHEEHESVDSPLLWLAWSLITLCLVNTHFYGWLLWGIQFLYGAVVVFRSQHPARRSFLLAQVPVLLAVLLLLPLLFSTVQQGVGGTWVPTVRSLVELFALLLFGFSPVPSQFIHGSMLLIAPWNGVTADSWLVAACVVTLIGCLGWAWFAVRQREFSPHPSSFLFPPSSFTLGRWVLVWGLLPVLAAFLLLSIAEMRFWAPRVFIGATTWLLIGMGIGLSFLPRWIGRTLFGLLLLVNLGPVVAYQTQWIKDYGRLAFAGPQSEAIRQNILVVDRYTSSMAWHLYAPPGQDGTIFAIRKVLEGTYPLQRVARGEMLLGIPSSATCAEIPTDAVVYLYDPYQRASREIEQWPDCIRNRKGWRFDPNQMVWVEAEQIAP